MPFEFICISDRRRVSRSVRSVTADRGLCLERRCIPPINRIHKLTALACRDRELLGGSYTSARCMPLQNNAFQFSEYYGIDICSSNNICGSMNNINNNNNNKWTLRTKVIPVTTGATGTIQKIPEQHTGKAQNQGTAANSHIGHCTRISRRTNVKVRNIQNEKLHVP